MHYETDPAPQPVHPPVAPTVVTDEIEIQVEPR